MISSDTLKDQQKDGDYLQSQEESQELESYHLNVPAGFVIGSHPGNHLWQWGRMFHWHVWNLKVLVQGRELHEGIRKKYRGELGLGKHLAKITVIKHF